MVPQKVKTLKTFIKPFEAPQKKCQNKNLTYFLFQYNFQKCTGLWGLKTVYMKNENTALSRFFIVLKEGEKDQSFYISFELLLKLPISTS